MKHTGTIQKQPGKSRPWSFRFHLGKDFPDLKKRVLKIPSINLWKTAAVTAAVTVLVPLAAIAITAMQPAADVMEHITSTVLGSILGNTLILAFGVALMTTLMGVTLAWLTTMCRIPGRSFFSWALLLPLAIPAYVLAFTYLGIFDYSGPVSTFMRNNSITLFPDIRSPGGVILVLSLAFYPYVYLLSRNAFLTQGSRTMEAVRSLGLGPFRGFWKVSIPMARPWIASGIMLVLMEVLADFGAVSVFNYDTFTTAIYKAWFGLFSLPAAAKLSVLLIIFSFTTLSLEKRSRSRINYTSVGSSEQLHLIESGPLWRWAGTLFASGIFFLAFILPVLQLSVWTLGSGAQVLDIHYFSYLGRTLLLGMVAALAVCTVAVVTAYAAKRDQGGNIPVLVRFSTMGYALPGTILAVGIFIPVAFADRAIASVLKEVGITAESLYLQGTIAVMILAYVIRFMAVGFHPIESSIHRVTRSVHETARIMGVRGSQILRKLYVPLIRGGFLTGAVLVLVDVMKEMPITLMTRPFGFDTLAVKIFEFTSEGEWERAAIPAITLILTGLIPVALLTRMSESRFHRK